MSDNLLIDTSFDETSAPASTPNGANLSAEPLIKEGKKQNGKVEDSLNEFLNASGTTISTEVDDLKNASGEDLMSFSPVVAHKVELGQEQ